MIPKAEVLSMANESGLLPTTVEKDYALGWVLFGLAQHPDLQVWIFKGGTCLKKCFFDTYRFSEDLDFTVPKEGIYAVANIESALREVCGWVNRETGIEFPADRLMMEELTNPRGKQTFQARIAFAGPLGMPSAQIQRIKFDITRDEVVVDDSELRQVYHPYTDGPTDSPRVRCYTLQEILAEKTRALYERSGRSRDVYDVVNISRNFREELSVERTRVILEEKFQYKTLPEPSSDLILSAVSADTLEPDWENALGHQVAVLPPLEDFLAALRDGVEWIMGDGEPPPEQEVIPGSAEEQPVPRPRFGRAAQLGTLGRRLATTAATAVPAYSSTMDRVRYAARNRLLARIHYHGVDRLVEPYSLRMPATGNLLLYVYELERAGAWSDSIEAFKVAELADVEVTNRSFTPQYVVEL
jgi:predicted nucleotidyltransferase component of viral defense system